MKLTARYVLTHTVPAWRRFATVSARLLFCVHTPAARPEPAPLPARRCAPHGALLEAVRHRQRALDVLRPHARCKPVDDAVADRDRLLLVFERNHRQHRTEYFFLRDAHGVRNAGKDRRLHKVAVTELR